MKEFNFPQGRFTITELPKDGNLKAAAEPRLTAAAYNVLAAGGRAPSPAWLQKIGKGRQVYCADKGLEYVLAADLKPVFICGDGDSAAPAVWQKALKTYPAEVHPRNKDDTDLQLLLRHLDLRTVLVATGVWGGRFDHLYSNLLTLAAWQKTEGPAVFLADEVELAVLVRPNCQVTFKPEAPVTAVSLLPLAKASLVNIEGVKWPLRQAPLLREHPYAVSNEVTGPVVTFSYEKGAAVLYFKFHVEQF